MYYSCLTGRPSCILDPVQVHPTTQPPDGNIVKSCNYLPKSSRFQLYKLELPYDSHYGFDDIASELGISASHCYRVFRQVFGTSPREYRESGQ
ncbi:helix-turn-helix transcriptional regulator [Paenibacillus borealis]|uniref:helix-turn-helix transcriptional regulator n=1 Tax=Paenibacillus borealis TaxID=160799 RepID=UPI000A9C10C8